MRVIARLSTLLVTLWLGACASDPPPAPPSALPANPGTLGLVSQWNARVDEAGFGRFSPYVTDSLLVAAGRDGRVLAVDRKSGARRWQVKLERELGAGVAGADGQLYVGTTDGAVLALAQDDGRVLWEQPMRAEVLAPPAAGFGRVVVRALDGRIVALNAADGAQRWVVSAQPPTLTLHGYSSPLVLDGGVLVGLDDGRVLALDLASGRIIWESVLALPSGRSEVERLVDIDGPIALGDNAIYAVSLNGRVAAIEPARGEVLWSQRLSSSSGVTLVGEVLVVVDSDDRVHGFDSGNGTVMWVQEDLKGRRLGGATALSDGSTLVVDVQGWVHRIDTSDGRIRGRARVLDAPLSGVASVTDGVVWLQDRKGRLVGLVGAQSTAAAEE